MNRRTILRTAAATSLALDPLGSFLVLEADNAHRKDLGIQFQTLRNDFEKILRAKGRRTTAMSNKTYLRPQSPASGKTSPTCGESEAIS